jgi:hypothetical protein
MALTAKKVYAILKRQISDMEAKLNSPVRYRGTVATADLLPLNPDIGDMYNIESKSVYGEAGMNVAWNGVVWDTMGAPIDMSLYIKSSELADWVKQQNKPTYTAEEVGALPADTKIPSKTSDLQNDSGFLTKIPDNYLSETDKTLSVSGKAADAKATGDKITELSANISNKLNKNQGSENSGKIAGINESGDIVPMFPTGVQYNEETNLLEFGTDPNMLNKGIQLDATLKKSGYAADSAAVGENIDSLKEDLSTKITKFYASNQGKTHLADSDNGKIMDMMVYGKSEQKQYSGKNLLKPHTVKSETLHGVTCTYNNDGSVSLKGTAENDNADFYYFGTFTGTEAIPNIDKTKTYTLAGTGTSKIQLFASGLGNSTNGASITSKGNDIFYVMYRVPNGTTVDATIYPQIELGSEATSFEPYTGGIPSPNPDYPQEIKSVVNPTVKVRGKNLLNYDAWSQTNCANGKAVYENNGVTITALSRDAFTNFDMLEFPTTARIPVNVGETITISWDEPLNKEGMVYAFGNASTNNMTYVNNSSSKQLKYTIPSGVTFITFRFGVTNAGDTISYRNIQIELGSTPTTYEPYHEQTVTLPYTLNAIPVNSGGNVTIGGQQYISDYVDVERGKLVRMVYVLDASANADMFRNYWGGETDGKQYLIRTDFASPPFLIEENAQTWCNKYNLLSNNFEYTRFDGCLGKKSCVYIGNPRSIQIYLNLYNQKLSTIKEQREWLKNNQTYIYVPSSTPEEINLTPEEIKAFKTLATYYPTTNISVNSEQLDGYTVFNYPISMQNGWNYVKQQIGDTRDYIYDMDARAQDTDLQAAEAYVNSEYAVVLTELEV